MRYRGPYYNFKFHSPNIDKKGKNREEEEEEKEELEFPRDSIMNFSIGQTDNYNSHLKMKLYNIKI